MGSCSSDVMECWDGSFVSRDPHNNCEFESCPAPPVKLDYQKLGHGYCRTPDGGKGDFDLLWYGNEWQCRDKCSSTNSCVGYEYQQHKNMCEIHKATVSHVDSAGHSGHGVVCFKKKQQPQPEFCSSDVMECWDGSFVSRDPHNNCEFESCPAQPVKLDYQKLGHGYCRTPDGGKGDFDLLWYGNEWQCRDKCSSTNSCVGYEYQQHKNMCEIHKAT